MPRRLLPFLVLTALAFSTALPFAQAAADRPYVYWFSQPVKPGETAMLQGEGWTAGATVSLARLADAAPGEPQAPPPLSLPLGPVPPLQARELSLKFVVPANQEMGIFACRVAEGDLTSDVILLNAPQVWWCQGDWGGEASPGGWLRVFGRCLSLGEATLALRQPGQKATLLKLKQQDTWSLAADLPATLPAGEYEVWVHNGKGGPSGWAQGGTVRIAAHPPVWGDRVFNVVDYGAIPDDDLDDSLPFRQALDAAANHGSGLVYFPGGRFYVEGRFDIPSRVLVKGAGQAFTHLSWPDTSEPPDFLLTGTDNFGIEDLGIFAINHRGILQTTGKGSVPAANIFVRRVTIQANRFCRPLTKEQTDQRRAQARGDSGLVLSGENVQLTDCDIKLDGGMLCAVHGDGGLIARNHFASLTDLGGWTPIGGTRIINEENTYWGITTGAGRCAELYWSHNQVSSTFSGFREGFTTDGTGGGPGEMKITAVNGTEMTAEKPLGRGESQKTSGAIHILTGTGAGQWRRLVSWKGNTFSVDRPWDVLPDETSVVSGSNFMGHFIMVGNTWTDTGIAIQLYGAALECVLAHNTSIRSGGFRIWGKQTGPGPTPCWYDEMFGNRILEGYGTEGPELSGGSSSLNVISAYGSRTYHGPMIRGVVIRDCLVENNAGIGLRSSAYDVLLENNTLRNSAWGVDASWRAQFGLLLRGNRFEQVKQPLPPNLYPFGVDPAQPGAYVIHPAEAALAGLSGTETQLGHPVPAGWAPVRAALEKLAQQDPRSPETLEQVQAAVAQAAQALPPREQPYPAGLLRTLFGLPFSADTTRVNSLLLTREGGEVNLLFHARDLAAWAPPLTLSVVPEAPPGWQIAGGLDFALKPGTGQGANLALTVPPDAWGSALIPLRYQVTLADGTRVQATESLRVGKGAIADWLWIGPFNEKADPPVGVLLPEQQLDVTASYTVADRKLTWQPVTSPTPALSFKDLLAGQDAGTVYAASALRAQRSLRVSFNLAGNASAVVYVNGAPIIWFPRYYRNGAATLQAGDNSILVMMKGAGPGTNLELTVQPLEPAGPADLYVVPAAELPAVAALRPATGTPIAQGKDLPHSLGLNWKLVCADNFDRRALGSVWLPMGGWDDTADVEWVLREGRLVPSQSFNSLVYPGKLSAPVRVELDVLPGPDRTTTAVAFTPAGKVAPRRLWGAMRGAGYFLALGWHDAAKDVIMRGDEIVVQQEAPRLDPSQWHHVIFQFMGARMMAVADGKVALDWTDKSPLTGLDTISLYQLGDPRYDNVRIYTGA